MKYFLYHLGGQTVEVGHSLVDGLYAISEGELVHDLLARQLEVDLPALLSPSIRKVDLTSILFTKIMEKVLVEARVLDVVRSDLDRRVMKNIRTLAETFNVSNSNSLLVL